MAWLNHIQCWTQAGSNRTISKGQRQPQGKCGMTAAGPRGRQKMSWLSVLMPSCGVWLAVLAIAGTAQAQQKFAWHESRTNQGCTFYYWTNGGKRHDKGMDYDWDGPCTPGQPINGKGTLSMKIKPGSGLAGRDNFYTGMFVDGVHDGDHQFVSTIQDLRNEDSITFKMGCVPDAESPSGFALGCTPRARQLADAEQAVGEDAKHVWVPVKTDAGCVYYLSILSDRIDSILEMRKMSVWSGEACQPGQPINGGGTLVVTIQPDGYPPTKSIQSGMMVNGVWDGALTQDDFAFTMKMGCPLNEHGKINDCTPYETSAQSARTPKDSAGQRTSSVNLDEDPWAAPVAVAPSASKGQDLEPAQGANERIPDTSTGQPGGAIVGGNMRRECKTSGFASLECQPVKKKPESGKDSTPDKPLNDAQKMVLENRRRSEEVKAAMARLQATGSSRAGVSNERSNTGQSAGAMQQANTDASDGGADAGGMLGLGGGGFAGAAGAGASCDTSDIDRQLDAATRRHANSVVRQMQALMWALDEKIARLGACQGAEAQIAEFQRVRTATQKTCDQTSSGGPCEPRL